MYVVAGYFAGDCLFAGCGLCIHSASQDVGVGMYADMVSEYKYEGGRKHCTGKGMVRVDQSILLSQQSVIATGSMLSDFRPTPM